MSLATRAKFPEISVAKLTDRLNVLLRSRGEIVVYDERDIGWTLRRLGIERHRNQSGMFVRFGADVRRKVHDLVYKFELHLPEIEQCAECARLKSTM